MKWENIDSRLKVAISAITVIGAIWACFSFLYETKKQVEKIPSIEAQVVDIDKKIDTIMTIVTTSNTLVVEAIKEVKGLDQKVENLTNTIKIYMVNDEELTKEDFYTYMEAIQGKPFEEPYVSPSRNYDSIKFNIKVKKLER